MKVECPVVTVIETDFMLRRALQNMLHAAGLTVELFMSIAAYLRTSKYREANCIVVDPQFGGFDLKSRLAEMRTPIPIVFITADSDVRVAVRAMKGGAVDYLIKPFREAELINAVRRGIARDLVRRREDQALSELRSRFALLSPRERQIMSLLAVGQQAKQIAGRLHICTHTARVHCNRIISKMGARSIADLVRMADTLARPANDRITCGTEVKSSLRATARGLAPSDNASTFVVGPLPTN